MLDGASRQLDAGAGFHNLTFRSTLSSELMADAEFRSRTGSESERGWRCAGHEYGHHDSADDEHCGRNQHGSAETTSPVPLDRQIHRNDVQAVDPFVTQLQCIVKVGVIAVGILCLRTGAQLMLEML
jgi:hypothetical protein